MAREAAAALAEAGLPVAETQRGYDHGVFVPLEVAWPDADAAVATLSLVAGAAGDDPGHVDFADEPVHTPISAVVFGAPTGQGSRVNTQPLTAPG